MNLSDLNPKYQAQVAAALSRSPASVPGIPGLASLPVDKEKPRLRQRTKPLLNGLETRFLSYMQPQLKHGEIILSQAITLKLANGCRLTPDFAVINHHKDFGIGVAMWEVKGPFAFEDSLIKLKVAATLFPFFSWTMASYKHGTWTFQPILP